MKCPICGEECERDEVNIGGGSIAAGPWGCPECHWVEHFTEAQRQPWVTPGVFPKGSKAGLPDE